MRALFARLIEPGRAFLAVPPMIEYALSCIALIGLLLFEIAVADLAS